MKPQPKPSTQEVLAGLVERVTFHNDRSGPDDRKHTLRSRSLGDCRAVGGQDKLKDGALGLVWGNPYAALMCLDNRTANRQAHTLGLRGEERVKYPVDVRRVDSNSGVRHRYLYAAAGMDIGFHAQEA